ncbi:unnamed protein product [Vitrella brassicaformis CCMP3155]|uniref:Uncharacterized protein n=1 Tax=Vitrella brassicaformis (strain CCMP3155) TaxID=1169540 RepID=A0A0G4ELK0_VITBC|nr:unnamed protein product [Vitrella brassicaformis CCMP3155]|eukprot:CEL97837.1 unnamed protein product [Vitrella brassicaformis CCMP3155]
MHKGGIDIEIRGECPRHGKSKINMYGADYGENVMARQMQCGCFPLGVHEVWVAMKSVHRGLLLFDIDVECLNWKCRCTDTTLLLSNREGRHIVEESVSKKCCSSPRLNFTHFGMRFVRAPLRASERELEFEVPISAVYWSHDSVGTRFNDGRTLQQGVDDLTAGRVSAGDIPAFDVIVHQTRLHALGNRRLAMFKKADEFFRRNPHRRRTCFLGPKQDRIRVRLNMNTLTQPPHKPKFTTAMNNRGETVMYRATSPAPAPMARCGICKRVRCGCRRPRSGFDIENLSDGEDADIIVTQEDLRDYPIPPSPLIPPARTPSPFPRF